MQWPAQTPPSFILSVLSLREPFLGEKSSPPLIRSEFLIMMSRFNLPVSRDGLESDTVSSIR